MRGGAARPGGAVAGHPFPPHRCRHCPSPRTTAAPPASHRRTRGTDSRAQRGGIDGAPPRPDEGSHQGDEVLRGRWKLGHQEIDHLETKSGEDEQLGCSFARLDGATDRAVSRGHAPPSCQAPPPDHRLPSSLPPGGGLLREPVPLAVDGVILDLIGGDRAERIETDLQVHRGDPDAPALQLGQHLIADVETCGGGGRRPRPIGVDRSGTARGRRSVV